MENTTRDEILTRFAFEMSNDADPVLRERAEAVLVAAAKCRLADDKELARIVSTAIRAEIWNCENPSMGFAALRAVDAYQQVVWP